MRLRINGLGVDCIIGERPDERERPQTLRVDAVLEIPDTAAESDDLGDTVDYAALAERIRVALAEAKCRMIERAAKVVAETCAADPKVIAATASVTKFGAIPGLESATAEYDMKG